MLGLREGPTVADASNLFDASFAKDKLLECGCNMHSRRYFVKALDAGDRRAAPPIPAYKKLCEIERDLRERTLPPDASARADSPGVEPLEYLLDMLPG